MYPLLHILSQLLATQPPIRNAVSLVTQSVIPGGFSLVVPFESISSFSTRLPRSLSVLISLTLERELVASSEHISLISKKKISRQQSLGPTCSSFFHRTRHERPRLRTRIPFITTGSQFSLPCNAVLCVISPQELPSNTDKKVDLESLKLFQKFVTWNSHVQSVWVHFVFCKQTFYFFFVSSIFFKVNLTSHQINPRKSCSSKLPTTALLLYPIPWIHNFPSRDLHHLPHLTCLSFEEIRSSCLSNSSSSELVLLVLL